MPAADDVFVSFAEVLRPPAGPELQAPAEPEAEPAPAVAAPIAIAEAERDVRLFRARLADAFADARDQLVRELAYAVLGRELLLAPPDVAVLANRILADHPAAQPLRLRVSATDLDVCAARAPALPFVADPALAPGDAIVEFADGQVDARLGVRLAAVLDEA